MSEKKINEMHEMSDELISYIKKYKYYRTIYDLKKIISISENLIRTSEDLIKMHKELGIN